MTVYTKSMMETLAEVRGLQEDNMDLMRKAAGGSAQNIKMKDGKLKMDMFTASAIMKVYDKVNPANQKKIETIINSGKKNQMMKLQSMAMKAIKSEYDAEIEEHKGKKKHKHPHIMTKDGELATEDTELDEGTWHIAKNMNALKKRMQKPIPKGDLMVKFVMKHIGDDELVDDMFDAKTGTDMVPMIKSAMKRLNIKEEAELDEGKLKDIIIDVEDAMGKIRHKVSQKGGKFIVKVSKNDEADAQKAMKNNPLYVAGKLRVVSEEVEATEAYELGTDEYRKYTQDITPGEPDKVDEASARADARRHGAMRGKEVDPADVDTDASDADVKAASKNIMMQMKKVISLGGRFDVEFLDKKKVKVKPAIANKFIQKYQSMRRPADKEKFQNQAMKSYKDLLQVLKAGYMMKAAYEEVELDEGTVTFVDHDTDDRNFKSLIKKLGLKVQTNPMKGGGIATTVIGSDANISKMLKTMRMKKDKDGFAIVEEVELDEALPSHLQKFFDKDGNPKSKEGKAAWERIAKSKGFKKYTDKQIKMAIGVAFDKRYVQGNMTGAAKTIEKIAKGLSNIEPVRDALRRANENTILDRIGKKLKERKNG